MKIDEGNIIEDQNNENIEIHIKGKIMQKSSSTISLKSIYDLVVNSIENSNKKFNILENNINTINKRLDNIDSRLTIIDKRLDILEKDIKEIKSLPTIQKELNLI